MTTITKERAEIKSFITGFLSDPAHDNQSSDSLLANVFRIALTSLEAKPVAWTDDEELRDVKQYGFGEIYQCPPDKYADLRRVIPMYRESPAPAVPDGLVRAVRFYEQVKRENPPVETGAWKDAVDWVLKEACQAVNIGIKGE
ncbi:hypothetical protein AOV65_000432 [Escherichia coli]|uniref:hypothetical protein n=1 Tax=Escherichia coli TaxID=562 RepID=UPI000BE57EA4|nr:hypothetical protein [Escherichia coli]EET5623543.1 hypothetical protein [Escherichia coli]EET5724939.1 hypothetical protein [Escherichia coli]EET6550866.1 hypothetical protein [Escherichia coli]EEW5024045.1 hypothetical protein [Escherichia coli]EFK9498512.1 hypothetical protein [Escherichia coli]